MKRGAALALVAAALFGAGAPVAKRLLAELPPPTLAGLLYLGAGWCALPFALWSWRRQRGEAPLRAADVPLAVGVIGFGGVAGPLLLLYGLARTSASISSLLLNLEVVFTTALAVLWLGEWIGRRGLLSLLVVVLGCALATSSSGGATRAWLGPLAVAGACLAWGIDNNLTARLALRDPLAVVAIKGLGAAPISFAVAWWSGARWPATEAIVAALALGALSYGASLLLYVRATRALGAARTGMLFAVAPFIGALLAWPLDGERPSLRLLGAAGLLIVGVTLLLTERHAHLHTHEPIEHEHLHVHDEHHQHMHPGDEGGEPHSHVHVHEPVEHAHAHASDAHHRHKH